MNRFIAAAVLAFVAVLGFHGHVGATARYCGTSPYDLKYRAIYEYPTGTYWQKQRAAYPDYYAAHDAQFRDRYGC